MFSAWADVIDPGDTQATCRPLHYCVYTYVILCALLYTYVCVYDNNEGNNNMYARDQYVLCLSVF